jgi:hypothetical protein
MDNIEQLKTIIIAQSMAPTHINKQFIDDNSLLLQKLITQYLETKVDAKAAPGVYLWREDRITVGRLTAGNGHEAVLKCDRAALRSIFNLDQIIEIVADEYGEAKVKPVITFD